MCIAEPAAVASAIRLAGPSARLDAVRPLAGGSHAKTYLLRTADPVRETVLREFAAGDPAPREEERVLAALNTLDGLAPRFLVGGPTWVLISRLPGSADIIPDDPQRWATQLGVTLAKIHAVGADVIGGLDSVFERRGGRDRLFGPAADVVSSAWDDQIADAPEVLTHGDYQSGNVIWENGTLTGVIDWPGAVRGPAAYDLGWCRFDLYLLYGEDIADVFLAAYEQASDTRHDPLLCDLWTLARSYRSVETWVPNYRDLGRTDLTAAKLRERHTTWTSQLLQRCPVQP